MLKTPMSELASSQMTTAEIDAMYQKITLRLIPVLFVAYVLCYLDRVNVSFAKLRMLDTLGFSEAIYGLGAGIFFFGYFLFEVPSNMILHRVGARIWIARIMITWGLLSASMMLIQTSFSFYIIRFLLGVAEAGFFPGVIFYLTHWYPAQRRARIIALFITAIPVSGVIGGPLSGGIMQGLDQVLGWHGWQWMFLLEGLPAAVFGVFFLFYMKNNIQEVAWLTDMEKRTAIELVTHDQGQTSDHRFLSGITSPRVLLLCAVYFLLLIGLFGISFWLPTIIATSGAQGLFHTGLLTAIPYTFSVVAMVVGAARADRMRERRWHTAIPMFVGAIGLLASVLFSSSLALSIAAFTLATMGIMTAIPIFWSLPTAFLGGIAAAAGIAFITSVGNLSGFVASYAIGWIKQITQSTDIGMYFMAASLVLCGLLVLALPADKVNR